jgi:hypothetical protein
MTTSTPGPSLSGGNRAPGRLRLLATGALLFAFIPLVLFLFVRHPEPIAASLAAGIALMLGHRFLARPYMALALPLKCLWCNRVLQPALEPSSAILSHETAGTGVERERPIDLRRGVRTLDLAAGGQLIAARCCASHLAPASRFFRFLHFARLPLRLGIFLPLLLLLAALAAAAAGRPDLLPAATALFQLLVGITVSAAAWGYLLLPAAGDPAPIAVPFPAHNFFLLGVRILLWIFRLVGAWWIVRGLAFFVRY